MDGPNGCRSAPASSYSILFRPTFISDRSLEGSEAVLAARLGDALGPTQRPALRASLAAASARLQAQTDAMWAQVDACLLEAGLKAEASP